MANGIFSELLKNEKTKILAQRLNGLKLSEEQQKQVGQNFEKYKTQKGANTSNEAIIDAAHDYLDSIFQLYDRLDIVINDYKSKFNVELSEQHKKNFFILRKKIILDYANHDFYEKNIKTLENLLERVEAQINPLNPKDKSSLKPLKDLIVALTLACSEINNIGHLQANAAPLAKSNEETIRKTNIEDSVTFLQHLVDSYESNNKIDFTTLERFFNIFLNPITNSLVLINSVNTNVNISINPINPNTNEQYLLFAKNLNTFLSNKLKEIEDLKFQFSFTDESNIKRFAQIKKYLLANLISYKAADNTQNPPQPEVFQLLAYALTFDAYKNYLAEIKKIEGLPIDAKYKAVLQSKLDKKYDVQNQIPTKAVASQLLTDNKIKLLSSIEKWQTSLSDKENENLYEFIVDADEDKIKALQTIITNLSRKFSPNDPEQLKILKKALSLFFKQDKFNLIANVNITFINDYIFTPTLASADYYIKQMDIIFPDNNIVDGLKEQRLKAHLNTYNLFKFSNAEHFKDDFEDFLRYVEQINEVDLLKNFNDVLQKLTPYLQASQDEFKLKLLETLKASDNAKLKAFADILKSIQDPNTGIKKEHIQVAQDFIIKICGIDNLQPKVVTDFLDFYQAVVKLSIHRKLIGAILNYGLDHLNNTVDLLIQINTLSQELQNTKNPVSKQKALEDAKTLLRNTFAIADEINDEHLADSAGKYASAEHKQKPIPFTGRFHSAPNANEDKNKDKVEIQNKADPNQEVQGDEKSHLASYIESLEGDDKQYELVAAQNGASKKQAAENEIQTIQHIEKDAQGNETKNPIATLSFDKKSRKEILTIEHGHKDAIKNVSDLVQAAYPADKFDLTYTLNLSQTKPAEAHERLKNILDNLGAKQALKVKFVEMDGAKTKEIKDLTDASYAKLKEQIEEFNKGRNANNVVFQADFKKPDPGHGPKP